LLRFLSADLLAISVLVTVVTWPAILAVVYTRMLGDDYRSLLSRASRGGRPVDGEMDAVLDQLASTLEERNRQLAALAHQASLVPIEHDPHKVASALVASARSVLRDPTWRLAIVTTELPGALPVGTYHDEASPHPLGDVERWAALQVIDEPAVVAKGLSGAFAIVRVAASERLSAVLFAPWQGRSEPTPAELDLLTLVGQHAGTALDHSLLYAKVRNQADELERLAMVQADFLRGVTHDLQTPLTSIGALSTELAVDPQLPASAREDLDSITYQAERLRRMVSQLLVASRLESGAFQPQQDVFAVQPVVERTWKALRADRPFRLELEGSDHLAVADPDRVEQVLWAVFDNAVKYSPPGSPIETTITSAERAIEIEVRDHGAGMDAEAQKSAFDQFYRSDGARLLAPNGSGVGLYAAKGLMQAMGGSIMLESALGSGATVRIRMPAEPSGSAE
jgi:K+-sensing histidine kinase KdpD